MRSQKDFRSIELRIQEIFTPEFPEPYKTVETIAYYKSYLKKNLQYPFEVTGIEDFDWEEMYLFTPFLKDEYEQLKKTNPSYKDNFELISLQEKFEEWKGILANVVRKTDQKKFAIPLAELVATDKRSRNYMLLDDYSVWFVNY